MLTVIHQSAACPPPCLSAESKTNFVIPTRFRMPLILANNNKCPEKTLR